MSFLKHFKLLLLFTATSMLVVNFSCVETAKVDDSLIYGKWIVVNAKRNMKFTSTLNDAFFEFDKDMKMKTNIMGIEESYPYALSGNQIEVNSEELMANYASDNIAYTIQEVMQDTMRLKTKIRDTYFEFFLLTEKRLEEAKDEDDIFETGHSEIESD